MSLAIPTVSYGFPVGGLAGRKFAKQATIPDAEGGVIYLPGGSAGQPISPAFLGSWSNTADANRWRGYVAFSLAEKLAQGGGSAEIYMEITPTHGGGTQQRSYLFAQHVIQLPDLFTPAASIRGVTRGAFEIANSSAFLHTNSTYRGGISLLCEGDIVSYTHVSGPATPDPNDDPFINGSRPILVAIRLLDFNGDLVSTILSPTSTVTGTNNTDTTFGVPLFSASSFTGTGTRPNNRKAAYLVSEIGLIIQASGNNFTIPGGGTWYKDYQAGYAYMQFDDADDALMQSGDTTMRSTWFSLLDYSSTHDPDFYEQIRGVTR